MSIVEFLQKNPQEKRLACILYVAKQNVCKKTCVNGGIERKFCQIIRKKIPRELLVFLLFSCSLV